MATLIITNFILPCSKQVGTNRFFPSVFPSLFLLTGVAVSSEIVSEFILSLSSESHSHHINFGDFRDFFILLPRKASPAEIYQYYEVRRYLGDDGRGPARVNMEGTYHAAALQSCLSA